MTRPATMLLPLYKKGQHLKVMKVKPGGGLERAGGRVGDRVEVLSHYFHLPSDRCIYVELLKNGKRNSWFADQFAPLSCPFSEVEGEGE